jgi:NTE family protein
LTIQRARLRRGLAVVLLALGAVAAHGEEPARPRVGLALGGGSAKGFVHVGVLRWLEEHRVPVDAIAGTSMGALIGGAYATGMSAAEIQELLRSADWDLILRPDIPYRLMSFRRKEDDRDYAVKLEAGLRHGFRLQSGLNSGHRIGLMLSRIALPYSLVESFDDLAIPFRCVATDLEKGGVVVLERGPLGPALRASMAMPGTFDPVRLSGRLLSDGGILNNIPVDVARAMGADVVIAVRMGLPEQDRPPETIGAVANRAIELMMEDLAEPRLRQADVVVVAELEGLKSSDYRRSDELADRGYAAAEAQAEALRRYALDADAWAEHTRALRERRRPSAGPFTFVEVTGVSDAAAAQLASRLAPNLERAPDPALIEADLDRVIGLGRYASAMYDRRRRGDQEGLGVEIRDKSYAPPLVKFSLDLDNENKDVNLTLGTRITAMDVTSPGSEWRVDASLGSTLRFASELMQPLGGSGPLSRGAFVAPRALYARTSENLYADDDEIQAIDSRQRLGGGLDLGWIFGRSTQLRAGYAAAYVKNVRRVGELPTPGSGAEQAARIRVDYDGQDRAYFPGRGVRFSSTAAWMLEAPDAAGDFGTAEAAVSVAWRLARRHYASLYAEGGASFGETPPIAYQFRLGGPFRVGALPPNGLRGPNLLLAGAGYRTSLGRLPVLLGDRLYLTALLEVGSVFDELRGARFEPSLTGGLAADTFFGPVFVGASAGNGRVRAYFLVGSRIR